mmetsp:Transcript_291/g.801  ORF Transcript_291/g.801 Transcript_291/m.801 type:complete len:227 (-) Transcript_291:294-974(-)
MRTLEVNRQACAIQFPQGLRVLDVAGQLAHTVLAEQVFRHIQVFDAIESPQPLLQEDKVVIVQEPMRQVDHLQLAGPKILEVDPRLVLNRAHVVHRLHSALWITQQALREGLGSILFHIVAPEVERGQRRIQSQEVREEDGAHYLDAVHAVVRLEARQIEGLDPIVSQVFQRHPIAELEVEVLFLHGLHEPPTELCIELVPPQVQVCYVINRQDERGDGVLRELRA